MGMVLSLSFSLSRYVYIKQDNQLSMLATLAATTLPPSSQTLWNTKIGELQADSSNVRRQSSYYADRYTSQHQYAQQRAELMHRRNATGGGGTGDDSAMDDLVNESSSLHRSANMVEGIIGSGRESLMSLVGQRESLKGVQKAVFDIGNLLGKAAAYKQAANSIRASSSPLLRFFLHTFVLLCNNTYQRYSFISSLSLMTLTIAISISFLPLSTTHSLSWYYHSLIQ
jgi:hypothetical protein